MYVLFCKNDSRLSCKIRSITNERVSHIALQFGEFVVAPFPKLTSPVRVVSYNEYMQINDVVYRHLRPTSNECLHRLMKDVKDISVVPIFDSLRFMLPLKYTKIEKLNFRLVSGIYLLEYFLSEGLAKKMRYNPLITCGFLTHSLYPEILQEERNHVR